VIAPKKRLTKHNIHKRPTAIPLAGIELAVLRSERPQCNALGNAATGIGAVSIFHERIFLRIRVA
jgi:hypothetical protein